MLFLFRGSLTHNALLMWMDGSMDRWTVPELGLGDMVDLNIARIDGSVDFSGNVR